MIKIWEREREKICGLSEIPTTSEVGISKERLSKVGRVYCRNSDTYIYQERVQWPSIYLYLIHLEFLRLW